MSNTRRISRRSFVAGALAFGLVAGTPIGANAGKVPIPVAFPSFTTTSNAPRIVSAHCGFVGAPMANPVPRPLSLQAGAFSTEPAAIKVVAVSDAGGQIESFWTPTITGTNPANPANVIKVAVPGVDPALGPWTISVYAALPSVLPTDDISVAYGQPYVLTTPARPAVGTPSRFSVAWGACSQVAPPGDPNRPLIAARSIVATDIVEFVHGGDTTYVDTWKKWLFEPAGDGPNTYSLFLGGLRQHFMQPDLKALYDSKPVRMVTDDHDSGIDNCFAANVYPQARQAFGDAAAGTTFDNAFYNLINPSAPSYDTWRIGEAQFWLLDCRLWRDTPSTKPQSYLGQPYASQIGATQRQWLKDTLSASDAPIKIIYSPRAFKQQYLGTEQQEILDWITGFKSKQPMVSGTVVIVSGDMHAGAVLRLSATRNVFEMQAGPMFNTTKHTTTAIGGWQLTWGYQGLFYDTYNGLPGKALYDAWGLLTFDTVDPLNRSVTINLMKDDGTTLYQQVIPA